MCSHLSDQNWFAIQVRPNHEQTTAHAIRQKGYEELLPTYRSRRKWSDRMKEIELPLFPGYIFCRFDAQIRAPLLSTPGVRRIVGRIEEHEILALHRLMSSGETAEPCPYVEAGTRVRLDAGPLAGAEGIVVGLNNRQRLVLSVALLRSSVAVEVDLRWITSAGLDGQWRGIPAGYGIRA